MPKEPAYAGKTSKARLERIASAVTYGGRHQKVCPGRQKTTLARISDKAPLTKSWGGLFRKYLGVRKGRYLERGGPSREVIHAHHFFQVCSGMCIGDRGAKPLPALLYPTVLGHRLARGRQFQGAPGPTAKGIRREKGAKPMKRRLSKSLYYDLQIHPFMVHTWSARSNPSVPRFQSSSTNVASTCRP